MDIKMILGMTNYKEYTAQTAIFRTREEKYCTVDEKDIRVNRGIYLINSYNSANIDTLSDA